VLTDPPRSAVGSKHGNGSGKTRPEDEMKKLREKLTYANVAATLALVLAVAGGTTAIAANKAPKNSVASSSIKPNNVTAGDLTAIRVVQTTDLFKAFAACAKREKLVGGGGDVAAGGGNLGASRPGSNGWYVQRGSLAGPSETPVTAYALCLKSKPSK
jgi:hypothetical protein